MRGFPAIGKLKISGLIAWLAWLFIHLLFLVGFRNKLAVLLQWTYSASGPPASPVASGVVKCAVDSAGHCYLNGFYQGTATFGTTTLQSQEAWNFFLTEVGFKVAITLSGSNVILTWPTNATGFTLQYTTNLVSPEVWTNVSPSQVIVNGQNTVTNPLSGTQRFYRLSN